MRKNIFQIGWTILGTWILMFFAWLLQMSSTAAVAGVNSPAANGASIWLMILVLGAGVVTTIIGYVTK